MANIDHDSLHKDLLKKCFPDFISLFFPKVYPLMDTDHLIPREQKVSIKVKGEYKTMEVDLLMETTVADEEVLIHVEMYSLQYISV